MNPTKQPKPDYLYRVIHGGSWNNTTATLVRAAYRYGGTPTDRYNDFGFRCAQRGARQPLKVTP